MNPSSNRPVFAFAFASTLLALTLASCNSAERGQDSSTKDALVGSTAISHAVELGNGYSEKTGKFLSSHCVTGQTTSENLPLTGAEVSFLVDASYRDIVDSLSGSLNVSLNLAAIKASAGAEYAKKTASTELSTNLHAYVNYVGQTQYIRAAGRAIAPNVIMNGVKTEDFCGTDFVSQIDYGASMAVTMEVTAKNKSQRDRVAGHLMVDLANFMKGEGNLESMDQSEVQDYNFRLFIKQIGGVPQNVALAIPEDGLFCAANQLSECINKMKVMIAYMKGQFKDDLAFPKNWNPINYHTLSYAFTNDLRKLAPVALTPAQRKMLETANDQIAKDYEKTMIDWKDVNVISRNGTLVASEKKELTKVREAITGNALILDRAINDCQQDYNYCMSIASNSSSLNLNEYDREFRLIGQSRQSKAFCMTLIQSAVASGELSNTEAHDLALEGTAPVFASPKDFKSAVIGTAPCIDLYLESVGG